MKTIVRTVLEQIKNISILLMPIIPISSNKVLNAMNIDPKYRNINSINSVELFDLNKELGHTEILFKKIENDN